MAAIRRTLHASTTCGRARAAAGVGATVLVQTVTVAAETPELLALADRRPAGGRRGRLDRPDQPGDRRRAGPAGRRAGRRSPGRHQAPGAVRARPGLAAPPRRHPRPARGRRRRASATTWWCCPHQLPAAAYAAAAVPGLTLVLDHAGKPPIAAGTSAPGRRRSGRSRRWPNTVCKLSGLVTEAPPGARARRRSRRSPMSCSSAFGADRVMFGSDWPVCLLASDYAGVVTLAQVADRRAVRRRSGRRCSARRRPAPTGSARPALGRTGPRNGQETGRGANRRGDRARSRR